MTLSSDPLVHAEGFWEDQALAILSAYVTEPALSPDFDPNWAETGSLGRAAEMLAEWAASRSIPGAKVELLQAGGRTPLLLVDVPPSGICATEGSVLIYGHLDKQPPFDGWSEGLAAYRACRKGDLLYGRGVADDGYSIFAAIGAVEAVMASGASHSRVIVLIEASEESGSRDLSSSLDELASRIGEPSLVVALDSSCVSYDRLWVTTSLRGVIVGRLRASVLSKAAHSGTAGGVIPDSFTIVRDLLSRVEDSATGKLVGVFWAEVPAERMAEARVVATEYGAAAVGEVPALEGLRCLAEDPLEMVLNKTWRPSLAITGVAGAPEPQNAGNVLRPFTEVKFCLRLPPTSSAGTAAERLEELLTIHPPHGAKVDLSIEAAADGWDCPVPSEWVNEAVQDASAAVFAKPPGFAGDGVSVPFLSLLAHRYPGADVVAIGLLGPGSNAHGPDECLYLPMAKRLTACLAHLLDAHATKALPRLPRAMERS